jgi:hypothetical protein
VNLRRDQSPQLATFLSHTKTLPADRLDLDLLEGCLQIAVMPSPRMVADSYTSRPLRRPDTHGVEPEMDGLPSSFRLPLQDAEHRIGDHLRRIGGVKATGVDLVRSRMQDRVEGRYQPVGG